MIEGIKTKKLFAAVESRVGWLTALATIPAGAAGLLLKDIISDAFLNPQIAAAALLFTAVILFLSEKLGKKTRKLNQLNWIDATVMGMAQALAIFPGISRSGSTISGGLLRNLDRKNAGQFSFLMSIPIMTAAGLLSMIDLLSMPDLEGFFGVMAIGFITSGIVGFFSIKWLLQYISNHDLTPFAFYCAIIGIGTLAISFLAAPNPIIHAEDTHHSPNLVTYQSSLGWLVPKMQTCTDALPADNLILVNNSKPMEMPSSADIHITYGELESAAPYAYEIGTEKIYFVASIDNPIDVIPNNELLRVISGEINTYTDLFNECASCAITKKSSDAIKIWKYSDDAPLSIHLQQMGSYAFSSTSFIAPTPSHMMRVLKIDPDSIGILPGNLLDQELKIILRDTSMPVGILAHSLEEPDLDMQKWLACLQEEIGK